MMRQMQQQQAMIGKLTNNLSEEKKKNRNTQNTQNSLNTQGFASYQPAARNYDQKY